VAGGLLLGVAATGLIGSVGTHSQQHPPSTSGPAEGTQPGVTPPIPTDSGASPGVGAAGGVASGPPACAPADLTVTVASDQAVYHPGQTVTMTSSVVARSSRACTVLTRCAPPDVFATFQPSPGVHSIDFFESAQDRACANAVAPHLLLPGRTVVEHDAATAAMPRGGAGCGTAAVDLSAQVYRLGADDLVHAVQASSGFGIAGPACPQATRRGPLG